MSHEQIPSHTQVSETPDTRSFAGSIRARYLALALSALQGCDGGPILCSGIEEPANATVYCHAPSSDLDGHPCCISDEEEPGWWAQFSNAEAVTTGWHEECPSTSNQAALEGIGWTCIVKQNGEFDYEPLRDVFRESQCDNDRYLCPTE